MSYCRASTWRVCVLLHFSPLICKCCQCYTSSIARHLQHRSISYRKVNRREWKAHWLSGCFSLLSSVVLTWNLYHCYEIVAAAASKVSLESERRKCSAPTWYTTLILSRNEMADLRRHKSRCRLISFVSFVCRVNRRVSNKSRDLDPKAKNHHFADA